jgi:hypothetical protein
MIKHSHGMLLTILILCLGYTTHGQTLARNTVSVAGETTVVSGITFTYVVGEAIAGSYVNNNTFLTSGFLQPELSINSILNLKIVATITAFPNPTNTGLVKLDFKDMPDGTYTIDMIDGAGQILKTQKINYALSTGTVVDLNLSGYKPGVYSLQIRSDKNLAGRAKLIML